MHRCAAAGPSNQPAAQQVAAVELFAAAGAPSAPTHPTCALSRPHPCCVGPRLNLWCSSQEQATRIEKNGIRLRGRGPGPVPAPLHPAPGHCPLPRSPLIPRTARSQWKTGAGRGPTPPPPTPPRASARWRRQWRRRWTVPPRQTSSRQECAPRPPSRSTRRRHCLQRPPPAPLQLRGASPPLQAASPPPPAAPSTAPAPRQVGERRPGAKRARGEHQRVRLLMQQWRRPHQRQCRGPHQEEKKRRQRTRPAGGCRQ